MAGEVQVVVRFGSVDDAARWFSAARFAGNMPHGSGLATADMLDAGVPPGSLVVTGEPARRWVVEPGSGERAL